VAIDRVSGHVPGGDMTWARKSLRLAARLRNGRLVRARLTGRGPGALESWHLGQLAIQWGAGASALPRAAPAAVHAIAAGGPRALAGGALSFRLARGHLLVAAGSGETPAAGASGAESAREPGRRPLVICALARDGAGILGGGGPGSRPLLSIYWSGRHHSSRSEIELALAGEERGLAGRVVTEAAGMETAIGLKFRAARGEPPAGARARGDLDLDLLLRRTAFRVPLALGARAELADPRRADDLLVEGDLASAATTRRAWLDMTLPIDGGQTAAFVRGEIRAADGRDRSRLHASLRTPLARAAADWTAGGGLGLGFRWRWDLPRGLTLEAGAATWSGPVAGTGATIDLPHVPEHGLLPRLSAPGQSAAVLMDWQMAQVRVRLGLATRRSHQTVPDIQVASRLDWAWPTGAEAP
jgi:hypothetical protein